jgi:hypothetical protein
MDIMGLAGFGRGFAAGFIGGAFFALEGAWPLVFTAFLAAFLTAGFFLIAFFFLVTIHTSLMS